MTRATGMTRSHNKDANWPPEHKAALTEYCATNMSFSEIRNALNSRFPDQPAKTRNSVLGKASRMGLRDGKPKVYNAAKAKKRGTRGLGRPRKDRAAGMEPVVLRDESDTASHALTGRRVLPSNHPTLAERRKGFVPNVIESSPLSSAPVADCGRDRCQWPTSDDITCMEVCGADVEVGAYCVRHASVAYRVMPTGRRNRRFAKVDEYQDRYVPTIASTHHTMPSLSSVKALLEDAS